MLWKAEWKYNVDVRCTNGGTMAVEKKMFGKALNGQEICKYTISNTNGMTVDVTDIGASLVSICVPDQNGKVEDVILGFDKGEDYYNNDSFFGVIVGPIANRTAGATITIEGTDYQLDVNDGPNNLHSHKENGYHKQIWSATILENGVEFQLKDKDGNLGVPGNKCVTVTYTLDDENALKLHYHATTDKTTVFNPTNHVYFNLEGHDTGSIEGHELWLGASSYTPVVAGSIPTGEIASVKGTPMDFTESKVIGDRIDADFEQLTLCGGYDHNWALDGEKDALKHFATVKAPKSGRVLKAYTTLPGVQFYAGNFIDPQNGKNGANYNKRHGLCLETQYYPDTNHHDNFPSYLLKGGQEYDSVTVYKFE